MAPKIFITGATGLIGGDALYTLHAAHPDYQYSLLVRSKDKAKLVQSAYPNARVVLGDLDDSELLTEEAANADIVLHCADASDHVGAANAIAKGLVKGHTKAKPGFWLHTGGTGILTFKDSQEDRLGETDEKVYDDWEGVDEVVNLPDDAFHRNVDKIVLEAGEKHADVLKTALVCPPTIYGKGRGPVSGRGRQVYELAKLILHGKYTPIVGQGKARWNNVHVWDLSDVYVTLVEKALAGDLNDELWGSKGYYFTENGEHVWGDLSRFVAQKAISLGYIAEAKEQSLSKEAALKQAGFEAVSWGLNSRGKAVRARKILDWKPSRPSIEDEVPEILKAESELLTKS